MLRVLVGGLSGSGKSTLARVLSVRLDYTRPVVMSRVLRRSFARATYARELWNGNTEGFRDWADPEHPVRWAWTTFTTRRSETEAWSRDPRWRHVAVTRLTSPHQTRTWLATLPTRPVTGA